MDEIENKNKIETINKDKCWFYDKIKLNKLFVKLVFKKISKQEYTSRSFISASYFMASAPTSPTSSHHFFCFT